MSEQQATVAESIPPCPYCGGVVRITSHMRIDVCRIFQVECSGCPVIVHIPCGGRGELIAAMTRRAKVTSVQSVVTASWWNQLHDPKEGRPIRDIPYSGMCEHCGKWDGHRLDCPEVDLEQLAKMVKRAQKQEELAKKRAKRYWEQLQRAVGRVATLRHENNKLRKANERLRSQ